MNKFTKFIFMIFNMFYSAMPKDQKFKNFAFKLRAPSNAHSEKFKKLNFFDRFDRIETSIFVNPEFFKGLFLPIEIVIENFASRQARQMSFFAGLSMNSFGKTLSSGIGFQKERYLKLQFDFGYLNNFGTGIAGFKKLGGPQEYFEGDGLGVHAWSSLNTIPALRSLPLFLRGTSIEWECLYQLRKCNHIVSLKCPFSPYVSFFLTIFEIDGEFAVPLKASIQIHYLSRKDLFQIPHRFSWERLKNQSSPGTFKEQGVQNEFNPDSTVAKGTAIEAAHTVVRGQVEGAWLSIQPNVNLSPCANDEIDKGCLVEIDSSSGNDQFLEDAQIKGFNQNEFIQNQIARDPLDKSEASNSTAPYTPDFQIFKDSEERLPMGLNRLDQLYMDLKDMPRGSLIDEKKSVYKDKELDIELIEKRAKDLWVPLKYKLSNYAVNSVVQEYYRGESKIKPSIEKVMKIQRRPPLNNKPTKAMVLLYKDSIKEFCDLQFQYQGRETDLFRTVQEAFLILENMVGPPTRCVKSLPEHRKGETPQEISANRSRKDP